MTSAESIERNGTCLLFYIISRIYCYRKAGKAQYPARRGYPLHAWDGAEELQTAAKMESRFPEKILKYYLTGLGALNVNDTRKGYARKAKVMVKDFRRWIQFSSAKTSR